MHNVRMHLRNSSTQRIFRGNCVALFTEVHVVAKYCGGRRRISSAGRERVCRGGPRDYNAIPRHFASNTMSLHVLLFRLCVGFVLILFSLIPALSFSCFHSHFVTVVHLCHLFHSHLSFLDIFSLSSWYYSPTLPTIVFAPFSSFLFLPIAFSLSPLPTSRKQPVRDEDVVVICRGTFLLVK